MYKDDEKMKSNQIILLLLLVCKESDHCIISTSREIYYKVAFLYVRYYYNWCAKKATTAL